MDQTRDVSEELLTDNTPSPIPLAGHSHSFHETTKDLPWKKASKKTNNKLFVGLAVLLGGLFVSILTLNNFNSQRDIRSKAANADVRVRLVGPASATAGTEIPIQVFVDPSASNFTLAALDVTINHSSSLSYVRWELDNAGAQNTLFTESVDLTKTEMLNKVITSSGGVFRVAVGANCTTASPWACYPKKITAGKRLGTLYLRAGSATGNVTASLNTDATQVAAIESGDQNVLLTTGSSTVTVAVTGSTTVCTGDINGDKIVNLVDYGALKSHYFQTCANGTAPLVAPNHNACNADLNKDGTVNLVDYGQLKQNYFKTCN